MDAGPDEGRIGVMSIRESLGFSQPVTGSAGTTTSTTLCVTALVTRVVLALFMLGASWPKLSASPEMVAMFEDIGGGAPMRILVGICEMAGAAGLMVPRLWAAAALGLAVLLLGACATNVVFLHENPAFPLVLAAAAGFFLHTSRPR
jgi:uncharacterized membrane protein YphA (DoxX/SURF4 family)